MLRAFPVSNGMESLEKLFGGAARLRLMRMFLFNPGTAFTSRELGKRGNMSVGVVSRELRHLLHADFIRRRVANGSVERSRRAHRKGQAVARRSAFSFNSRFPYLHPLRNLLMEATPLRGDLLIRRLGRIGKLKLLVASGIFVQEPDSRLDLLIVADRLSKGALERTIRLLESEIGKELRYAVFNTADFTYRLNVYDKLLRDVFDFRHQKILDRMDLDSIPATYPQALRQPLSQDATI